MLKDNYCADEYFWCVIPVFNNRETVRDVVVSSIAYIRNVLVIDDGSSDVDLAGLLADLPVTVIRHPVNRGKGKAILTALRYIQKQGGRFMITIDADGQHYPRDLEKFKTISSQDPAVLLIGSRNFDTANVPPKSRFGRKLANFWILLETGIIVDDSQSGFRGYPVESIAQLNLSGSHYDFEVEVLVKAAWAGLKIKTIPVDVFYPLPEQRVTHFRHYLDNIRISLMHARLVMKSLLPFTHRKEITKIISLSFWQILRHPVMFLKKLLIEHSTPSGLAASAFVGIFLAVLPIFGLHSAAILYVTTKLHLNKIMALAIQNICIPPFVPMICVEIGYYLRFGRWLTVISWETFGPQLPQRIMEWFLGSLIVAPVLSFIVGVTVFLSARILKKKIIR
ncbi:MAG: DUF2062 domain-containing protein [Elusimicrobiota bacterium]